MGVARHTANTQRFLSDVFCTCLLVAEGPGIRRGKFVGPCSLYRVVLDHKYRESQIWAPKFVQGLLASITDIAVRRLSRNVLGDRYVSTAVSLLL
jgi:hypothetical protein